MAPTNIPPATLARMDQPSDFWHGWNWIDTYNYTLLHLTSATEHHVENPCLTLHLLQIRVNLVMLAICCVEPWLQRINDTAELIGELTTNIKTFHGPRHRIDWATSTRFTIPRVASRSANAEWSTGSPTWCYLYWYLSYGYRSSWHSSEDPES
jgi:hypothetical protein